MRIIPIKWLSLAKALRMDSFISIFHMQWVCTQPIIATPSKSGIQFTECLYRTPWINAQCLSMLIQILALIPMPINSSQCQSIPLNANQCSEELTGIDQQWSVLVIDWESVVYNKHVKIFLDIKSMYLSHLHYRLRSLHLNIWTLTKRLPQGLLVQDKWFETSPFLHKI